tara:strand:- start:130 stop:609 length:480 start_codon:yes stop_codon:yes gene_type:complete
MRINFNPAEPQFETAANEYGEIWNLDGRKIVEVWQEKTGIEFEQKEIDAKVFEGVSRSRPFKLRASYPYEVKRSILIHELGHILIGDRDCNSSSLEVHKTLFLRLYDVLHDLYGDEYADSAVLWEKENLPKDIYFEAWEWALSFSKEERESKFNQRIER